MMRGCMLRNGKKGGRVKGLDKAVKKAILEKNLMG